MLVLDKMVVKIVGVTPLLIHNGQCANPFNAHSKKLKSLTSKRNKTEDDQLEIMEAQWEAGLYWSDKIGLHFPSQNLYTAFYKAAKKHKLGTKCSGISFPDPIGYPIITENHNDLVKLRANQANRFIATVVMQRAKTITCRPIFQNWSMEFEIEFERDIWDANEIKTVLVTWASRIGLGVWTPGSPKPGTHGKFLIESITWIDAKTGQSKEMRGM